MKNVSITKAEVIVLRMMDYDKESEMFGQIYVEDFGCSVSPELIERYKKAEAEFASVQRELRAIHEGEES